MKTPKKNQLEMKGLKGWGGKRKGAGRKNRSGKPGHSKRQTINGKAPLHVTWRLKKGLPNLRCEDLFDSFKKAAALAKEHGLHLIHFSIQSNHLHLEIECKALPNLTKGMSCIAASFGRAIRRDAGGRGGVFDGRYHLHVLTTPSEVRNGMAYVLLNQTKHGKMLAHDDRFSSGPYFREWRKLLGKNAGPILEDRDGYRIKRPDYLSEPRTWLAREGWRKVSARMTR